MASKFGWIDFSEDERKQMLRIVDLMRQQDTRDELGVGTIRDAFSENFFPGTSTIQTRARYFLFVPWLYQDVERRMPQNRYGVDRFTKEIEYREKRLIRALMAGGESEGVIGIEAKEKLQRLPSNIYWSGLKALKIGLFEGSQSQYARYVSYCHRTSRAESAGMASGSKEHDEPNLKDYFGWHPGLPKPPKDLLSEATLKLTHKEAVYLKERVLQAQSDSLFASFLLEEAPLEGTDYVWEHPIVASLPQKQQDSVLHAQNFSEALHGAALLYNLMLAEASENEELINRYNDLLEKWAAELSHRWAHIENWCGARDEFWKAPALIEAKIPENTKQFVDNWLVTLYQNGGPQRIFTNNDARMWVRHRELQLKKKNRARLHNDDALLRWAGASGTSQLSFRWGIAKNLLTDIYTGLNDKEGTNA